MDLLSNCPSLATIISYLKYYDVRSCLTLNRRINFVISNNWRRMQKAPIRLVMEVEQAGPIVCTIHRGVPFEVTSKEQFVRITPDGVYATPNNFRLILQRFPEQNKAAEVPKADAVSTLTLRQTFNEDCSEGLHDFLEFLLKRTHLKYLEINVNRELTIAESSAMLGCFRMVTPRSGCEYTIYYSPISPSYPLLFRISEHIDCPSLFYLEDLESPGKLDQLLVELVPTSVSVGIRSYNFWNATSIVQIIEKWKRDVLGIECIEIFCRESSVEVEYAEQVQMLFDLLALPIRNEDIMNDDQEYSCVDVRRPIDKKRLRIASMIEDQFIQIDEGVFAFSLIPASSPLMTNR